MINNFVQCGKIDNKTDRVWGPLALSVEDDLTQMWYVRV